MGGREKSCEVTEEKPTLRTDREGWGTLRHVVLQLNIGASREIGYPGGRIDDARATSRRAIPHSEESVWNAVVLFWGNTPRLGSFSHKKTRPQDDRGLAWKWASSGLPLIDGGWDEAQVKAAARLPHSILFGAEGEHGIGAGGAQGGDECGGECNEPEHCRNGHEGEGVGRGYAVEK